MGDGWAFLADVFLDQPAPGTDAGTRVSPAEISPVQPRAAQKNQLADPSPNLPAEGNAK